MFKLGREGITFKLDYEFRVNIRILAYEAYVQNTRKHGRFSLDRLPLSLRSIRPVRRGNAFRFRLISLIRVICGGTRNATPYLEFN